MSNLSLMMIIINKGLEKKCLDIIKPYKINFQVLTYGKGSASSSLLNYFALDEIEKVIVFAILPKIMSKHLLLNLEGKLEMNKPGGGIAITLPLSSSTKYMQDIYRDVEMEDIQMEEANRSLIITIANEGFAESIMNAGKKVGATGGTVINGRGLETEKIVKFLGISIEPEKDIVLIIVENEKKNDVMNSIIENCGLKTPGAGICFSIPVENVAGLNKEFNLE